MNRRLILLIKSYAADKATVNGNAGNSKRREI